MKNENIEDILKKIGTENVPEDIQKIAKETSDNFSKELAHSKKQNQHYILEFLMKSKITKLAAAAVIIIAVLAINFPFSNSGVAWASLAEKIESVKTVVFHITANTKMQGIPQEQIPKTTGIGYYSSEYGVRSETYMNDDLSMIMYLNPEKNLYLTLIPESKTFIKVVDKSQVELRQIAGKEDPRVMVRRIMLEEYTEIGRDRINGKEVEGIECSGPGIMGGMFEEGTARLWVEIGTEFPVRLELEGVVSNGQMELSMVMENFQWDVELEESLFIPEIPSDYKKQEMTVETDEAAAIKGLRLFAEITGGRYPESLVFMSLMKEVSENITKNFMTDAIENQGLDNPSTENITEALTEKQGEITQQLSDILKTAAFYNQLVGQGKDVVYYGDTVTTDNPDSVLMRWEIAKGVYRVVFADLNIDDYTTEELAALEKR